MYSVDRYIEYTRDRYTAHHYRRTYLSYSYWHVDSLSVRDSLCCERRTFSTDNRFPARKQSRKVIKSARHLKYEHVNGNYTFYTAVCHFLTVFEFSTTIRSFTVRGGRVVRCRTCDREVAGSNPTNGYCIETPTQRAIPPGSVNEYQRKLGSKRAYHVMH